MSELSYQRDTVSPTPEIFRQPPTGLPGVDIAPDWSPSTLPRRSLTLVHTARPVEVTAIVEQELRQYAEFLAAELKHNLHAAQAHHVLWYQLQLGPDVCTFDDAAYLRTLTMGVCREHRGMVITMPPQDGRSQPSPNDIEAEIFHQVWNGLALIAVIVVALILASWMVPHDRDLLDDRYDSAPIAQTDVQQ